MTLSDLAKYSMTRSTARSLCDSWAWGDWKWGSGKCGSRLQGWKM